MLTFYGDESIAPTLRFTIVAGYVGDIRRWETFEVDWKLMLAHYDVPHFHMESLAHWSKPYDKWKGNDVKRANFVRDAADIISSTASYSIFCQITDLSFVRVNAIYELSEYFPSPYALASFLCIETLEKWRAVGYGPKIRYVLEDGEVDISGVVKAAKEFGLPIPSFEPGKDWEPSPKYPQGRKGLVQLQPSDYCAYEVRKAFQDRKGVHSDRKSLRAIVTIPQFRIGPNQAWLEGFCSEHGIKRRKKA